MTDYLDKNATKRDMYWQAKRVLNSLRPSRCFPLSPLVLRPSREERLRLRHASESRNLPPVAPPPPPPLPSAPTPARPSGGGSDNVPSRVGGVWQAGVVGVGVAAAAAENSGVSIVNEGRGRRGSGGAGAAAAQQLEVSWVYAVVNIDEDVVRFWIGVAWFLIVSCTLYGGYYRT